MGIFSCNYGDCEKRAHKEVFYEDEESKEGKWCYLCFWHYVWIRFIKREKGNGYSKVESLRESVEWVRMDIWEIQGDLIRIKEKLKIKEKKEFPEERPEEKSYT